MDQRHPLALTALALLVTLAFTNAVRGQDIDDGGAWFALLTQGHIHDDPENPWKWWFDGHMRLFDDNDGYGQSIVRPAIGYTIQDWTIWGGYAWIRTSPVTDAFDEHRCWQQITSSKTVGDFKLGTRSRLEQRFVETGDDVGWRFRQFLSARKPLADPYTLVVWDEMFFALNDTDWGADGGYDQNRIFVGIGVKNPHCGKWRTEIGYLYQHIRQTSGNDVNNHLLAVNLFRSP